MSKYVRLTRSLPSSHSVRMPISWFSTDSGETNGGVAANPAVRFSLVALFAAVHEGIV